MAKGPILRDFTAAAAGYFGGVRIPATLLVGSTLGALFAYSKASRAEHQHAHYHLVKAYHSLMMLAFVLSFSTTVMTTVATVSMLQGDFDPFAETAYQMLKREFDYEFTLTRWSFNIALLCFIWGVAIRATLEFELLKKSKRVTAITVGLIVMALICQLTAYINSTLYSFDNLFQMTIHVFKLTFLRSVTEQSPLQFLSLICMSLGACGLIYMVVYHENDDDDNDEHEHGGDKKKKR